MFSAIHTNQAPSVKSNNTPFFQAKLTVNEPGDEYEQEADAVADKVMRMPNPTTISPSNPPDENKNKIHLKPIPFSQISRKCADCEEEEKVQRKESTSGGGQTAPSIVNEVITSSGKSLDSHTQEFMESRMGHDFSHVQVHTDGKAAESAASVNALAYTSGNHIVFNNGQYAPDTEGGKRLLAHELAHVGLQSNNTIKRKIIFNAPQPTKKDPIPLILGGKKLGLTTARFNGNNLPNDVKAAGQVLVNAFNPQNFSFKNIDDGKSKEARIDKDKFDINVSASMDTITAPTNAEWSGSYAKSVLNPPRTECATATAIPVTIKSFPNLHTRVATHENEHWTDIKKLTNSELKPYHDMLLAAVGKGATEEAAVKNLIDPTIQAGDKAIVSFLTKLLAANNVYDNTRTGTHHTKTKIKVKSDCSSITIEPR